MSEVSCRLTLTSFVPRQVMLEMATNAAIVTSKDDNCMKKKRRKDDPVAVMEVEDEGKKSKKKKSSKISNPVDDGSGSAEILAFDRPSSDAISLKGKWREDLLRSIAAFLEGNGFVKTLSVFCSEARIEVNSRGGSCINLEDLYNKFVELSKRDPVVSIEWSKEQDAHTKDKKRKIKQVSDLSGQKNSETNCLDATIGAEENTDNGKTLKVEKKKKHKVILGENMGEVACVNIEELAKEKIEKLNDLTNNPTIERFDFEKDKGEKKKKKKKEVEQFLELSELGVNHKVIADGGSTKHQESVKSDNAINDLPENVDGSKKEKKKNKNKKLEKSTSDSLHAHSSDKLVEGASDGVGKHNDGLQKFGIRKDSFAIIKENIADVETTTNKKRKRSSSKETEIQIENITAAGNSKESKPDVAKVEKETGDLKVLISSEPSPLNQKSVEPCQFTGDKDEKNANLLDPLKQMSGHQVANGELEKHQKEGSPRQKSMKKEKHSGDLKVGNAFQRVKVDEVQFADERLQNNSYWALDDSGSGYGAKAQEVLGQVRGRDFRHEKTKKKRGTYRGGQIDLHSHSIKFNYSDEE